MVDVHGYRCHWESLLRRVIRDAGAWKGMFVWTISVAWFVVLDGQTDDAWTLTENGVC